MQLRERAVFVAEQALGAEAAVLHAGAAEVEEAAAVLFLVLITVEGHAVVGELLLSVGERAGVPPALSRGDPVEAQLVAELDVVALVIVVFWAVLDAVRVATALHVVKDGLGAHLLLCLGVAWNVTGEYVSMLMRQVLLLEQIVSASIWGLRLLDGHEEAF